MELTNKNMLVAGDFYEQTINLIPESINDEEKLQSSIARYKGFTEQISAINPAFTFDYSRHPALTIMDGENVLAVAVSPELRNSHLGNYACASAVFNSAFADKKTFDDVAKSLALMGGDIQHFNVRKDLGDEYSAVASNMFTAVKNGTQNAQKLSYLNDLYVEPEILLANYMKIRDAETEAYLARTKTPATSISYAGEPDEAEAELKRQHDKAIAENKEAVRAMVQNTDPDLADDLNNNAEQAKVNLAVKNQEVHEHLTERNEIGKEDVYWLDKAVKDNSFMRKLSDKPVFGSGFQNIRDYVVADGNGNELFRTKTGLRSRVVMTHAGLMNPAARAIAQEYAIRKGFDPINIRLPKLDGQQYSNTELVTFMKNSMIEFHENFDVPFNKIRVPKQYQKLFDDHMAEYLKNKTEIGFADTPEPEQIPIAVDSPAMHDAMAAKQADPAPAVPVEPSSQSPAPDVAPVVATPEQEVIELPAGPVQAAPVVDKPSAPTELAASSNAPEAAKPAPVVSPAPAPVAEPEPKKTLAIAVSSGMFILPSKRNEGKGILWGKVDVVSNLSAEQMQTGIIRLCEHNNLKPSDLIGFWRTESKVSASPVKKGDFLEAKALVSTFRNEPKPEKEYVVDRPDQFEGKSLSEKEADIAKMMGTPEVLDSPQHKERQAINDGSIETPDELDLDAALAGLKDVEASAKKPKLFGDDKTEPNKKIKFKE
jgi:hypothetical protein